MKKLLNLFFLLVFLVSFSATKSIDQLPIKNCHAQACMVVSYYEGVYGDDFSYEDAEAVYENAFNDCNS
tara:strand:+ start:201 stop:407 length:207 start_codon:yes stop_codon:yes gene_type:complete